MVWTLSNDIEELERALVKLKRANPDGTSRRQKAEERFCAATRIVCHAVLTAVHNYPGVFEPDLADDVRRLFTGGLDALDGAPAKLRANVEKRYDMLRPWIERA